MRFEPSISQPSQYQTVQWNVPYVSRLRIGLHKTHSATKPVRSVSSLPGQEYSSCRLNVAHECRTPPTTTPSTMTERIEGERWW